MMIAIYEKQLSHTACYTSAIDQQHVPMNTACACCATQHFLHKQPVEQQRPESSCSTCRQRMRMSPWQSDGGALRKMSLLPAPCPCLGPALISPSPPGRRPQPNLLVSIKQQPTSPRQQGRLLASRQQLQMQTPSRLLLNRT